MGSNHIESRKDAFSSDINHLISHDNLSTPLKNSLGGTFIGNAAVLEQSSVIPHLARAYLDKRANTSQSTHSRFLSGTKESISKIPSLQSLEPKNKNYHPDTLLRKLEKQRSKKEILMTLAATNFTPNELLKPSPRGDIV